MQVPIQRRYCFQAWHSGEDLVSQTVEKNQAMAQYLQKNLGSDFAKKLDITAAEPATRIQSLVVPRTVYVSVRDDANAEVDHEDIITTFRDEKFTNLARDYFEQIQTRLDFHNCFLEGPEGRIIPDHFATVRVRSGFYNERREIRLPRHQSWGEIGYGVGNGIVAVPISAVVMAWESFQESNPEPRPQPGNPGAGPAGVNTAASQTGSQNSINFFEARATQMRRMLEWAKAQTETVEAVATVGTSNSYCQFKDKTRELINMLHSLNKAHTVEKQGEAIAPSKIWRHLVRADTVRRHCEDFIVNLNQTGLLDNVVANHSSTRSTGYATVSVLAAGGGVYSAFVLPGWPLFGAIMLSLATTLFTGNKALEHKEYRDRVSNIKVHFDSFRRAWDAVAQVLVLQFATASGVAVTIEEVEARDNFMRNFGLDSHYFNESDYTMANLKVRVKYLEKTFAEFTENVDWIDEHDDLGLQRGVEAA